ncbi:MAG: hypothetical protein HYZ27_00020, partial [Deltaproteobacteria bacterium]|nr:hypothetical protein [Deltaproteobacteria bacterium]
NQIIEVLSDEDGIQSQKVMIDTGREIFFNVVVPSSKKLEAIKTLNKYELPRRADRGYGEVFKDAGMIPTNAEERAKGLAALEGEVERQLKLIDGILDAQVQVVVPQESALRTTREQQPETTASVTIKFMPAAGGSKPVDESVVKRIVANGVEKLVPERVEVLMMPAAPPAKRDVKADGPRRAGIWGWPIKTLNMMAMGMALLVFLLCVGLVYMQTRLRVVRGRLIRLQGEIAKARRKPATETNQQPAA